MGRTAVIASLCLISIAAFAQTEPKVDVFGGYQFLHVGNFDGDEDSANTSGWNASAAFHVTRFLSVAGDFGGGYQTKKVTGGGLTGNASVRVYTYTFGPVVSFPTRGIVQPFVHVLFGGARVRPTGCVIFSGSPDECGSGNASGFAMVLGGGLDLRGDKHMALRIIQLDWLHLPAEFGSQNSNVRASAGVVFHF